MPPGGSGGCPETADGVDIRGYEGRFMTGKYLYAEILTSQPSSVISADQVEVRGRGEYERKRCPGSPIYSGKD